MKIAVPVTNDDQIDGHFGHCEFYSVFTISEKNEISDVNTIPAVEGCGCKSNIAGTLAEEGVTVMLAGGIGAAFQSFAKPMACDRSLGPTNTASMPSTFAIADAFATPSGVSIMAISAIPSLLRLV